MKSTPANQDWRSSTYFLLNHISKETQTQINLIFQQLQVKREIEDVKTHQKKINKNKKQN